MRWGRFTPPGVELSWTAGRRNTLYRSVEARISYDECTMQRTQIYPTGEQRRLSKDRSQGTGCTVSELTCAAIDNVDAPHRELSTAERIRLARRTAGAWKDFSETGAEHVERVRGSRRLSQAAERQ